MLVGHMADVHLGANHFRVHDYVEDTLDAFREALDLLLAERPDVIVVAGDLFDKPNPPNSLFLEAVRGFRRAVERGVRVVFAVGEHDQPARRDAPSVAVVAEAVGDGAYAPLPHGASSLAELVDRMTVKAPGGYVMVFPFVRDSPDARRDKVGKLLKAYAARARGLEGPRVFLAHMGLLGSTIDVDAVASPADLPPVEYAALGHVHRPRVEPPGEDHPAYAYPGSLVPVTVSEVDVGERGPLLVDLSRGEPSVQRLAVEPPRSHVVVAARLSSVREVVEEVRRALRGVPERRRKTLVHLRLRLPPGPGYARAAAREAVAAVERELGVVARVVDVVRDSAGERGGARAPRAPAGYSEVDVVESVVENRELAELIVRLKEALLAGDGEEAGRIVAEILSPRFDHAWARLLGGAPRGSARAGGRPSLRQARGLEGWLG